MKATLSVVLSAAVIDEHITRNPCSEVRRERRRDAQEEIESVRAMDGDQRALFLEACKESRFGALFATRVMTGLRPSEPYAIRIDAIDWRNAQFHMEESVELLSRRVKKTKTRKIRVVDIPSTLVEILREHLANLRRSALKKGWGDPSLLFPSDDNTILDHANVVKELNRVLKRAGLPHFTPYEIRHTYASFALANGAPLTYVAAQMGISVETVLRYYAHWIPSKGHQFADIANGLFDPESKTKHNTQHKKR